MVILENELYTIEFILKLFRLINTKINFGKNYHISTGNEINLSY